MVLVVLVLIMMIMQCYLVVFPATVLVLVWLVWWRSRIPSKTQRRMGVMMMEITTRITPRQQQQPMRMRMGCARSRQQTRS